MRLPLAFAAVLMAAPFAAAAQPAPRDEPAVTREADGSFTVNRVIEAEPPADVAHGLVEADGASPPRMGRERSEAKRMKRARAEADLRRAMEEAVDWGRAGHP